MWQQIFLAMIGISAGMIIAGGVVGLLIGLSIVPRYAGITHTSDHIVFYENAAMLGIILGNLFYLFEIPILLGNILLAVYGIFSGIFLGGWILALAEVADIFPVFSRRIRLKQGASAIILAVAFGKTIGAFFFFFYGWQ